VAQPNRKQNSPSFEVLHQKGELFEKFVVPLFPTFEFTLLEWRGDKSINGIAPLSCKNPDLVFRHTSGSSQSFFAVECKFRYELKDEFELKTEHFESYQSFIEKTHIPVYLVLGIGNRPDAPNEVFVVPLQDMPENLFMSDKQLLYYRRDIPDQHFRWYPATRLLR
jgi:hypothetical protein